MKRVLACLESDSNEELYDSFDLNKSVVSCKATGESIPKTSTEKKPKRKRTLKLIDDVIQPQKKHPRKDFEGGGGGGGHQSSLAGERA